MLCSTRLYKRNYVFDVTARLSVLEDSIENRDQFNFTFECFYLPAWPQRWLNHSYVLVAHCEIVAWSETTERYIEGSHLLDTAVL